MGGAVRGDPEATPFSSPGGRAPGGRTGRGGARAVARDGARRGSAGRAGAARRRAARAVPGAERARPPAGELLERAGRSRLRARQVDAAVAAEIRARAGEWHALLLGGLPEGSAFEAALRDAGLRVRARRPTPYPGIELPGLVRELPAGPAAQAPQGPAAPHAPARRRPARAARRDRARTRCARRSTAGRTSACAGGRAAARPWTPSTPARASATSCATWSASWCRRGWRRCGSSATTARSWASRST